MSSLTQQLQNIPTTPGVYIYKDEKGSVLYVGKAKVLRSRVRSYFNKSSKDNKFSKVSPAKNLDPAKKQMVKKITDIETISTDNETEALVLEANLIRKHQPPYNVVLRDDKYYLFIKITKEEFPRIFVARKIRQDGARYFGPFSSAYSVRATLKLLRRIFPYRSEKDSPRDIIFPHPLFASPKRGVPRFAAPKPEAKGGSSAKQSEVGSLNKESYQQNIDNIIRFLKGKRSEVIERLKDGMQKAAKEKHYEQAGVFRDQLRAIERLEGNQKVYLPRKESFDVISLAREKNMSAANIFQIRAGKLLGKQTFLLQHRASASPQDTLRQFILQYYGVAQDIPKAILVPHELEDSEEIAKWINEDEPPAFVVPQRGKKRQLLGMGETNAAQLLTEQQAEFENEHRAQKAHIELVKALNLNPKKVHRIETYDISNIQGQLATASMVVFIDGKDRRDQYRKFRLAIDQPPREAPAPRSSLSEVGSAKWGNPPSRIDDYAAIKQTLERRFAQRNEGWPMPDLVIIDGGKGQLSSAKKILDELNVETPVISIAKREEEIFTCPAKPEGRSGVPSQFQSIRLSHNSDALYLIQRMRDEAHRFTITYHRLLRSKKQRRSILDEVPGIGPKTKKKLLAHFGSLKNIRAASDKELVDVIGVKQVEMLRDYL